MTFIKRKIPRSVLLVVSATSLAVGALVVSAGALYVSAESAPVELQSEGATNLQQPVHISGPGGTPESLAGPAGIADVAPETKLATIQEHIPAMGLMAPADRARFRLAGARGQWTSNGFASTILYIDDTQRQAITIGTWNKVGDFNLVITPNSPVLDYTLTSIDGLYALTILPSPNVVGGLSPRTVYLYRAGIIYAIDGEGFLSDDSFLSVVHNFISEVTK